MSLAFKCILGGVSATSAACAIGVPANDWGGWYSWEDAPNYNGGFNSGALPCQNTNGGYKKIQTGAERFYPYGKEEQSNIQFFMDSLCQQNQGQQSTISDDNCQCATSSESIDTSTDLKQQVKLIDDNNSSSEKKCYCMNGAKK